MTPRLFSGSSFCHIYYCRASLQEDETKIRGWLKQKSVVKMAATFHLELALFGNLKITHKYVYNITGQKQKQLTVTLSNPTKPNKGKWRKCVKSDYLVEGGLIWARNRCLGSDTWVACCRWTVHCGAGSPRFESVGTPLFWPLPFWGDSLKMKKGARELGLKGRASIKISWGHTQVHTSCNHIHIPKNSLEV